MRKADRTTHLTGDNVLSDISETGALLNLDGEFQEDSTIGIEFSTKEKKATVRARVVRSTLKGDKKYRTGVQFMNLNAETGKTIKEMVEHFGRGIPIQVTVAQEK